MAEASTCSKDLAIGDFPADFDQNQDHIINRLIVVSNELPIKSERKTNENGGHSWDFTWDENSLYMHIKDSFPSSTMEVCYVGLLRDDVDPIEQDEVKIALIHRFNCFPVFVSPDLVNRHYHRFCKGYLWPIFHYEIPLVSDSYGGRSDRRAYITVNETFSLKVVEVLRSEHDHIWIHDYHLMFLPTFLRKLRNRLRIGFFLHTPFPAFEVFGCIPMRYKILMGLLNSDVIAFQTLDYARHFLGCCSRIFGLDYEIKQGYVLLEYQGRVIWIKVMASGINVGRMESLLREPDTKLMVRELERCYEGKTVMIGVDDLDRFKGVNLKVLAMEEMLKSYAKWVGKAVLVQILNPARWRSQDVKKIVDEMRFSCNRINWEIGKAAIVTPVRDGMNLMPYEYIVCRQAGDNPNLEPPKTSMVVVSEFIGCSSSLSGALRVNPWDAQDTAAAMNGAMSASVDRKQTGHAKHYRHITENNIEKWSRSFVQDLRSACVAHNCNDWSGVRSGLTFGVAIYNSNLKKLSPEIVENAYRRSRNRAILLEYDGTIQTTINKRPTEAIISILNKLCDDSKNTVFVISGRSKEKLSQWFWPCEKLAIAAEHGYFIRWVGDGEWEMYGLSNDFGWMEIAKSVMNVYRDGTDGSDIEHKGTAIVWHHEDVDRDVGLNQARELLYHLRSLLANQPVVVSRDRFIVEAKPPGVDKGRVATKIFERMAETGRGADFVLCIGGDKSDEDMFVAVGDGITSGKITNEGSVFACTVGRKPTRAEYYLDDAAKVLTMLEKLVDR
ncbi:hypothetical protein OSB04_001865 [Centaurea solstitialis]|uniref:Uncharacterized protein n=1 Tax=Centaurea solstitialis TaxID=347529 RepID=A0AA38TTL2_9ASTR|nr:hypothetical protein OSB04_001865 [Centaurea solstitialis]